MRLTVETGPLAGTVVTLDRAESTLLGSGPDCAVRVQEAGVLEQHAVVKALRGEGFGIKALGTGLRLNGTEVTASPLHDGDILELGTTRIAFGETQSQGLPRIPGYRVIDVLGKGGMGMVYRAEQVSLHREVALKVLNRERIQDPVFISKFVAEARAAAKLQHPNVVAVFDVEHDGDLYYYAMELMPHGSCEDWLRQHGAMPVERALQVIADAAHGLAYAESLGIVHRDIKPDNLMLDQHGTVKIADLGLASTAADSSEERAIGTPHFMAPEQVLNKELDHRTDLYALGCTFYRLVTGRTPFRGTTVKDILRAQVKDDAEPAHKVNAQVTAEVGAIIQKLMAKEPQQRYQTANALLEELEALLQPPPKRTLWIALAAVAVLVAGGAIYWAVNKPKEQIVKEVRYDDPEKQRFADRIVELERELRLNAATIALQGTRLSGKLDDALATAFDEVAAAHPDTPAAIEAAQRAAAIRRELLQRQQELEARRSRIAAHLTAVRSAMLSPLEQFDFVGALRALDQKPADDLIGDHDLGEGLTRLRGEVLDAARARLQQLHQPVATATAANDEAALSAAIDAMAKGLEPSTRWPTAVAEPLAAAQAQVGAARTALDLLRSSRITSVWQRFEELVGQPVGDDTSWHASLTRLDFAAAAARLDAFAGEAGAEVVKARAAALAEVARRADAFAAALVTAIGGGEVELAVGDTLLQVTQWDRAAHQLLLHNPNKRGAKDEPKATSELMVEQWLSLADQVPPGRPGDRECFLGLLALDAHARAAASFLRRIEPANDDSGTGDNAYPFGSELFDQVLARLPASTEPGWQNIAREEFGAGAHLASGLRALSERRNLAAAGHLEKLFADYPHSFIVAAVK